MMLWEDNDTYALPGHTMVRPGGIGEAKEPMKQSHLLSEPAERKKIMIQVKCISGETEYIETELSAMLTDGWEIISIETAIYESYGNLRKNTTAYLKKVS